MSNHSVIEHRANYYYIKLEEDYIQICSQGKEYPHCKAFILAILEHWMDDKRSKGQSEYIYMSYPQWIDAMYGLFRRNHIINCLNELVQEHLIFKRPYRIGGKDTFEYCLNVPEVQNRLKVLEERKEKYTRPKVNAFKFKRVCFSTRLNLNDDTSTNLNASEGDDPFKFTHNIDSITEIPEDIETEEESTGEQSDTTTFAPSLSLDAAISSSPQSNDSETHTQQGDIHGTVLPTRDTDLHRPLELPHASGAAQDTPGDPHGVASTQQQEITRTCDTCGRPQTQADCPWCMTTRLPAIPKQTPSLPSAVEPGRSGGPTPVAPVVGGQGEPTTHHIAHGGDMVKSEQVSHEQNRDASPGNVTVESDLGAVASVPIPPVPPEVTPPRTMRATVVSPPPQVLVVSQQFSSVEDWKQAQESFVEQLRGIWKTASADFKRQAGNWNVYRKQYLDRWLKANPEPLEVQFTDDGKALFDEWCSLFKVKVDAGKANIEAANWLAEPCATWATLLSMPRVEVLRDEKAWLYANDKKGYFNRGVKLFDLKREFEGWQSYQQSLLDKAERSASRPQNKHGTVSGLPRLEIDPEWLKAMGGR